MHQLAKKFQMLHPDDLIPLVNLVKANQTSDMYVKEDGEGMYSECFCVFVTYAFFCNCDVI